MASRAPRRVMIDDTDDAIRYTGVGWFQDNGGRDGIGGGGPTYLHTQHGTNVNGSLAYTFKGTSIWVFGTLSQPEAEGLPPGLPQTSWECFVDKISMPNPTMVDFPFSENNRLLCDQSHLADGQHEITVNIKAAGQPFWFDYIQYTPSPSLSLETSVTVAENDDPSILLDSKWRTLYDVFNTTQATGSTATFQFTGTSVSWVGCTPWGFPHNASNATYSVDGGLPMSFPLNVLPVGAELNMINQIFFTTPDLTAGPHSLVVVHHGTDEQTPLTLDYLYVNNTPTSITSSMSSSTAAKSSATTNPTPPPRKGRLPVGEIIGGVVAGLVLISLTLFFLWKYKRRLQHSNTYPGTGNVHTPLHVAVSPFTGHSASRVGWSISKVYRGILINPSSLDGLGPQMQRGAVTKPLHPSQPPLVPTGTTESAMEPQMQRGRMTKSVHPSSPPPVSATDQTQPTSESVGAPQHAPSAGPLLIPELHAPVVDPIAQTTPMAQLRNPEEHIRVIHQDSGLRFSGTVISDVPPMYTEA